MVLLSGGQTQKEKGGEKRRGRAEIKVYEGKRGEGSLKQFTKAVLYVYPSIGEMEKAYAEHIRNKAILSYKNMYATEGLVRYVAGQICRREKLLWLNEILQSVVDGLDETDKALLQIRYFGKKRKNTQKGGAFGDIAKWSASKYFRMQRKLEQRVEQRLIHNGLTEQVFDEWFAPMEIFRRICAYLQTGGDSLNSREKAFLA